MCGIFALITNKSVLENSKFKKLALKCAQKIRHRGPDGTGYYQTNKICFVHERLSIIDPEGGNQPLVNNDETLVLCVNGEIFNYKDLKKEYPNYRYKTKSDCEPILALYESYCYENNNADNNDNNENNNADNDNMYYCHDILVSTCECTFRNCDYPKFHKCINTKNTTKNTTKNIININKTRKTDKLAHQNIVNILEKLDGQFSFILHDKFSGMILVARDPFGITQCYYGMTKEGYIMVASEMKALEDCVRVSVLEAGHYLYFNVNNLELEPLEQINYFKYTENGKWQLSEYESKPILNDEEQSELLRQIRTTFENAVIKRLMTDVPFGILLSGGLDSSLVASVAVRYIRTHPEIYGENPIIHTFSIGDKDGTDLPFARKVADFLGTRHHEIPFTVEEGLNAIEDIIYYLETYDITTIRASTPHYLLSRKIQSLGIKMVLSGEGSDEILGGYLYFHQAPSDEEHQIECKKRVMDLGYFDCLRADKSTMANGLEGRYPFLDTEFVKLCININKDVKTQKGIEKYILREAFSSTYLPDEVLWRQKEQFSDSVTYRWIDTLKEITEKGVKDNYLTAYNHRDYLYSYNTPHTMEAFYYRIAFEKMFSNREKTVKYWLPNTRWSGVKSNDPSGRAQGCHINTTM
jgi:asparagine synthase (glutamine-hydrolysing)